LKLSILLAQYFYQHKQLNLPGIGSFHLDAAVTVPDVNDKNFREFAKYIQFTQNIIAKPDDALIDFIRSHTGKIKPLAESDLESYLGDGKLLLNIGKPFHLEGIGTLQKNKLAIYEFTAGEPITERLDIMSELKEADRPMARRRSAFDEGGYSQIEAHHNKRKRLLVTTLVLIALAVILWGGYSLYNNKKDPAGTEQQQQAVVDTPAIKQAPDTAKTTTGNLPAATTPAVASGNYKFIVETTTRKIRALKRHAFLLTLNRDYKLETSDSLTFNITVTLPATPADTLRLKDSLNGWYYGPNVNKVRIAQ
jgi:hypothetical protein